MTAGRLCSRILATASPDESVRKAASRMAEYDVGALVVLGRIAVRRRSAYYGPGHRAALRRSG
jgi:CBS domain-containing protein